MKIKLNIEQREHNCNNCPSQRLDTDGVEMEHLCLSCDRVIINVYEDMKMILPKKKEKLG